MNHWKQRKIEPMKLDGVSISSIILEEREESERRMLAAHQQDLIKMLSPSRQD